MEAQDFIKKYVNLDEDNFSDKLNEWLNNYETLSLKINECRSINKELNKKLTTLVQNKNELSIDVYLIRYEIKNIKKKINIIKNKIKKIEKEQKESLNSFDEKDDNKNIFTLPFSYQQIENIDKKYKINSNELINNLNDSENKKEKLLEIIEIYEQILNNLKEEKSKDIHTIEVLLKKLNLYYTKTNKEINRPNIKEEKKEIIKLTSYQKEIELAIKKAENLEDYNLIDCMTTFNYYLQTNSIELNEIEIYNCLYYLNNGLIEYMFEQGIIFPEFVNVLDTLKYKINQADKSSRERQILKKIFTSLRKIYDIYKNNCKKNVEKNYYFEILNYWLQDESNYLYIKELLKRHKEVYNLKYNDKHIAIYILDLYIENFKKMVKDKNSNYVNLKYLEEVYYLFTKNYYVRINEEEKEEIDLKLKEFREYIKRTLKSQKRKNYAIDTTKKMKSVNFYKTFSYYEFQEFDDDLLGYESNNVNNCIKYDAENKNVKEAVLFGNDAYNIEEKEDKSVCLTIYATCYNKFITNNSVIDRYLEKCEMTKEKIDDFFKSMLDFKVGKSYPVFAYELEFYPSGKIKSLEIKKDYIIITEKVLNPQKNNKSQMIQSLFHKSVIKNGGTYSTFDFSKMNEHFEKLLENLYIEFLKRERLPYIYYGCSKPSLDEIEQNMNDLAKTLNEIDKSLASDIINIINTKNDTYHYSNLPIPNGEYKLNLLNPISYLGLENQRMLDNLYFNTRLYSTNERIHRLKLQYLNQYIKKVEELNKNLDYIDPEVIKINKGRIKNRIKL